MVDVEDVGAGGAGGDGYVVTRLPGEPLGDLLLVGGGVQVAVRGGGDLLAGLAGEHRPAAGGVGEGLAEGGVGHGVLRMGGGGGCSGWFRSSAGRPGPAGSGPG